MKHNLLSLCGAIDVVVIESTKVIDKNEGIMRL